eukprot:TRINITY_DN80374_c0_g1_i1.p1 TRINITY_DN80374_c0_g1~~TRINITY_DN80374_c0_g1_i1.p1  ORF type:complete len:1010 (-),score=237.22 TRINITY_DN80374_c0_g1_i1:47-3076(-)
MAPSWAVVTCVLIVTTKLTSGRPAGCHNQECLAESAPGEALLQVAKTQLAVAAGQPEDDKGPDDGQVSPPLPTIDQNGGGGDNGIIVEPFPETWSSTLPPLDPLPVEPEPGIPPGPDDSKPEPPIEGPGDEGPLNPFGQLVPDASPPKAAPSPEQPTSSEEDPASGGEEFGTVDPETPSRIGDDSEDKPGPPAEGPGGQSTTPKPAPSEKPVIVDPAWPGSKDDDDTDLPEGEESGNVDPADPSPSGDDYKDDEDDDNGSPDEGDGDEMPVAPEVEEGEEVPKAEDEAHIAEVASILESWAIPEKNAKLYAARLVMEGVESIEMMNNMREEDFRELGFKTWHVREVMKHVRGSSQVDYDAQRQVMLVDLKMKRTKRIWSRRRSVHQPGKCNTGGEMGGSETFLSCLHPNMKSGGRRRWFGHCKCLDGYQQGPDDDFGSQGICVKCGCKELYIDRNSSFKGYRVDLCPEDGGGSGGKMTNTGWYLIDNLLVPTVQTVASGIWYISETFAGAVVGFGNWVTGNVDSGKEEIKQIGNEALIQARAGHAQVMLQYKGGALRRRGVWEWLVNKWNAIKDAIHGHLKEVISAAKVIWDTAVEHASAAWEAAKWLKDHVAQQVSSIIERRGNITASILAYGRQKLEEMKVWGHEQYLKLSNMSGNFQMNDVKMQLAVTNPTQAATALGDSETKLTYQTEHGQKMTAICRVPSDAERNLTPQGQTGFECSSNFDTEPISSNKDKLTDFLGDAAKGSLGLEVEAEKVQFGGQTVEWTVQTSQLQTKQATWSELHSHEKKVQHITMDLPEDFVKKAADAIAGLAKLKETPEESLDSKLEEDLEKERVKGEDLIQQAADAEIQMLNDEVAAAENAAREEDKKAEEAAHGFEHALQDAAGEAKLMTANGGKCRNNGGEGNCGQHDGTDYDWCRTENSVVGGFNWDRCVIRGDTAHGWKCKNNGGEGDCERHGAWTYTWCRTTNGEWDYCVPKLFDENETWEDIEAEAAARKEANPDQEAQQ